MGTKSHRKRTRDSDLAGFDVVLILATILLLTGTLLMQAAERPIELVRSVLAQLG